MTKVSRILCVVDPTTKEQHAVKRAARVAGKLGADLELFICFYNEYLSGNRFFDSPSLEKARKEVIENNQKYLDELAKPLANSGLSVSTKTTWAHPLYDEIVRYAAASGADLVFKDTHHHSAAARALLSNTDWQLIRNCASPLWLVKPRTFSENPVFVAAIDPMNEHDKPAALDDEIIMSSKALAEQCDGELHVFHAYDPRIAMATSSASAYLPVSLPIDEIDKQMRDSHGARFSEITEHHRIDADKAHLVSGLAHEELPELAGKLNADVVAMGAVSRNRLKRLFVGATAERTLDHLPCDLLIIKPSWFETPAEILEG